MARLSISLLGLLQANLDGAVLTNFVYDKVWALFVYLAVEAHHPHRRVALASLFWADFSEERARSNLRQTLTTLRHLLSDRQTSTPFLLATRQTIQFNPNSSYSLDVTEFLMLLKNVSLDPQTASELTGDAVAQLEQAIALYRGEFLAEVKTFDSETFEEWIVLTREKFHGLAVEACTSLVTYYNHHRNWQQLQRYAQRLLKLEPWNEFAHQCLMQVLTYCGQRGAAVQQYKMCAQTLATQLQTEPDEITTELYEQIRNGSFALPDKVSPLLSSLPKNFETTSKSLATVPNVLRSEPFEPSCSTVLTLDLEEAIVKIPSNQPAIDLQEEVKADVQAIAQPNPDLFDTTDQLNRHRMLEKVHIFWIKGVLENSLHNAVLINLCLEERPDTVAYPWNLLMQFADQTQRVLAPETKIVDVYEQFNHSFLILGAPGAGKTTLLLDLARSLLILATQDPRQPMPVVFNLSSWVANSLATWLVSELQLRYQVPQQLAQQWIKEAKILPLLDGLDEVALSQRDACVEAINQFRTTDWLTNLVVCSRTVDYEALTQRLQLHGAILVQPLTLAQTDRYLEQLGDGLTGVRSILQQDITLQELANTPLMVQMIALAYQAQTIDALQPQTSPQHWQNQLFATYVQRMLVHRGVDSRYDPHQVANWLAWLARTLAQRDQTLFLIEQLQPDDLLSTEQRRWLIVIETVMVALLMGIAGGMGVGLHQGLATGWADGIIPWLSHGLQGMMHGLGAGLMVGIGTSFLISLVVFGLYDPASDSTTSHSKHHSKQWRSFWDAARIGVTAGISQGLAVGLFLGARLGLGMVLIVALCTGIAAWRFLEPGRVVLLEVWRWSWSRSRLGIVAGMALGSVFGVVYGIGYGVKYGWVMSLAVWLIVAIAGGFTSGEIETKILPNQGIHHSMWGAWRMSLAIGIPFGLANAIGYGLTLGWAGGIGKGISSAIESGTACWLICGGLACIQHLAIRYLLYRSGVMPWNYAAFLDYAAERTFLRKVGGNYIFVHRLLLEYFATLDQPK